MFNSKIDSLIKKAYDSVSHTLSGRGAKYTGTYEYFALEGDGITLTFDVVEDIVQTDCVKIHHRKGSTYQILNFSTKGG